MTVSDLTSEESSGGLFSAGEPVEENDPTKAQSQESRDSVIAEEPAPSWIDRFFAKIGMPRDSEHFSRGQWGIAIVALVLVFGSLVLGIWSWTSVLIVNLVFVFIGSSFRLAAHGQSHQRWRFTDGLGKLLAYTSALIAVLLAVTGAVG